MPYKELVERFKDVEFSAVRCPTCGAKMASHAKDHLCRMHRDSSGLCTVCNNNPVWHEEIDDMDNSTWEAASPYGDDDVSFYWRLKPRISENKIEWYECHDLELMDEDSPRGWPTIEDAKAAITAKHAEIIETEAELRSVGAYA